MTNSDSTEAYIYYDVFNQYGESIRASENIEWTVSGNRKAVDKTTGKITVSKSATDKKNESTTKDTFTYGTQIYVTGVHVKSGKNINKVVTTGMAQSVNSIKFEGFVNNNEKTKKLENLPKDFAKNTYYLIYKTYDQNDNPLDVNDADYTYNNLTFICDSPLLLSINAKDAKVFTIDGEEYAAVAVEPGQYVDKGGEVNITAISNKTGKNTTQNYVIGKGALLKSFVLSSPANVVADGDENVVIPYTAKDTDGNTITNYETIVRSTNSLTLTASEDTSLVVKEANDGTAVVLWSDDKKDHAADNFSASSASDDVNRNISLTTVVVGGESSNMMLEVSDTRRPAAIKSIKLNDDNNDIIVNGNKATLTYLAGKDNTMVFLDQYGAELKGANATAFFNQAKSSDGFGKNKDKYCIKVETATGSSLGLNTTTDATDNITLTANLSSKDKINEKYTIDTVKFAIAKYDTSSEEYVAASKVKSVAYTIVSVNRVQNYVITDLDGKTGITTNLTTAENGKEKEDTPNAFADGSLDVTAGKKEFKVKGTFDGKTVTLPVTAYTVAGEADVENASGSAFTISHKYKTDNNEFVLDENGNKVLDSTEKDQLVKLNSNFLKWSDLYDYKTYGSPRKDAEADLKIKINKETHESEVITKTVTVSDEAAQIATLQFVKAYQGAQKEGILYPDMTKISGATIPEGMDDGWGGHSNGQAAYDTLVRICGNQWAHNDGNTLILLATDQYGSDMFAGNKVTFTVSDVKENTTDTAHVANNFTVNKNGTLNTYITGAEIGDTFTLTAKVSGTKLSTSIKITVGADKAAYIDQSGDGTKKVVKEDGTEVSGTKDKGLRELLGYNR